jgi:KTSC domain
VPAVPRTWWEQQGYKRDHAVHKGTEYYSRNTPADDFAGQVREDRGQEDRGGDVRITVAPTRSSDPGRPRTRAMGYDGQTDTLRIVFREGAVYDYFDVTTAEWNRIKRSASPGKFINRVLGDNDYVRIS